MDWTAAIDLYCERTGPGLWSEPLNAFSNLAFPAAALWGWTSARQRGLRSPMLYVLITLAGLIGVGSFLFHIFANHWSEWADVIPIWSFVALYIMAAVHLIGGVAPGRVLRIALIVAAAIIVVMLATSEQDGHDHTAPVLNGSLQYAPALLALVVFSVLAWRRRLDVAPWVLSACAVFIASLVFRTVDLTLCPAVPHGTHFMWHLLNGAMVGILLQALIRHQPRARPSPR